GFVADRARGSARLQVLHFRVAGGERLRPCSDRKHGGLGAGAGRQAVELRPPAAVVLRSEALPNPVRGQAMNVIEFPAGRGRPGGWAAAELKQIVASVAPSLATGEAVSWEVGATETGDPQFYLLGSAPDHDCILCVSRLGALYVLEDGTGRLVFEHVSLRMLAEAAKSFLHAKKAAFVARAALAWYAVRELFEEKVEAILGETEDLLVHVAPQLAVLG